jgi:predicted nuclease of restriction endonuclease-like (RecB) superfamily
MHLAADYRQWLGELQSRFRQVQLKAAVAVNTAMLQFYWDLGADMVDKQTQFAWGGGFVKQLSVDLMREFPDVKGFSVRNLKYIRQWHEFWLPTAIGQQAVAQLAQQPVSPILSISWGHNLAILTKFKQHDEALYYAQATQTFGWSRSVLVHQIESGLWLRDGKAITNFEQTLPLAQSDLAMQMLKDPYKFDFLSLSKEHTERDFFLDLLFYHTRLHCHVVVELKTVDFEPEFAGKLNFYIKAVDEQLRGDGDHPTMGPSTYTLSHKLPEALRDKLPSIEAIERELGLEGQGTQHRFADPLGKWQQGETA